MAKIVVNGGKKLEGSVSVGGAKNATLPILAASIMSESPVNIINCPEISDVWNMVYILRYMGCGVAVEGTSITVDATKMSDHDMPEELSKEMRSSIFMLGPMLSRFKRARFTYPGGCEIGLRPIDLHLKGLSELNVKIEEAHGQIICNASDLTGNEIHLDYPSVGATENIMMAAVSAKGRTMIRNAAREPEVAELQKLLNAMGGRVRGAGTSSVLIEGTSPLHGVVHEVMPDRIVAGTYMVAAAITGGDIKIMNAIVDNQHAVISKLKEAGCTILPAGEKAVRVIGPERPKEMQMIETLPYPGFPTDMQAQFFALASVAEGTSIIVENVFESRFKHAAELSRMGASVKIKGRMAVIRGVSRLMGARVRVNDLRGGAALVLAGLRAEGETEIENAQLIDRGYENFAQSLAGLGAEIRKED
ncbi:MAG: UDP-N-acetylglucosamine 1-carboxyvinyltransferase [Bacillota bacterium]|nr:UDP-N-acetylglucosamine 1-carboxyvinyltransferase [Bacillota bacterium]